MRIRADLCVIGAGAGGLTVAAGAARMGAKVVLVEGGAMGGDCLNHGCVPSKALLAAARIAQAQRAGGLGVAPAEPLVDFAAVQAHIARTVARIAPTDSQERFEAMGVRVIRAMGHFTSPTELAAGEDSVTARRFVIASGARPRIPDIPGLAGAPYLTNETVFALTARPDHLIILGAGPTGCELAQAHARLGVKVTLIEAGTILASEDLAAVAMIRARLQAEGVALIEGVGVTGVAGPTVTLGDGRQIAGSHLLIATGRAPATAALNLAAARIAVTERGVTVDRGLRTSNRRVFAIGDAAGGRFTHEAGHHASIVIRQALLGLPARTTAKVPRVLYTDPELAQIGPTEAEARRDYPGLTVERTDLGANDRAATEAATEAAAGFVKLMIHRGRAIGVTICAPQAGELILPWSLALSQNLPLGAIAAMIAPYPTLGETSKRAAGAYFSPRLFDSPMLRLFVRAVQRVLP